MSWSCVFTVNALTPARRQRRKISDGRGVTTTGSDNLKQIEGFGLLSPETKPGLNKKATTNGTTSIRWDGLRILLNQLGYLAWGSYAGHASALPSELWAHMDAWHV